MALKASVMDFSGLIFISAASSKTMWLSLLHTTIWKLLLKVGIFGFRTMRGEYWKRNSEVERATELLSRSASLSWFPPQAPEGPSLLHSRLWLLPSQAGCHTHSHLRPFLPQGPP